MACAKKANLTAISITDHDCVDGIPAALQAAGSTLEIIPGIELTAAFKDRELHILGYGFRIDDAALKSFLCEMRSYREKRIQSMIDRLHAQGITVSLEEVQAIAGKGGGSVLGRPHLAEALMKRGAVSSFDQAFERYLGDRAPCFVKGATVNVQQVVELIRKAGGITVLAHPYRMVQDAWLPELLLCGIHGIEVYHCDHSPAVAARYRKFVSERKLLMTGGSDCHGLRKKDGSAIGSVFVPYELVERLKEALKVQA